MAFYEIHITPMKTNQFEPNEEVDLTPKLTLAPFNPAPEIDFGCVHINTVSTKYFKIYNPSRFPVQVHISENGFSDERIKCSETEHYLQELEEKRISITWAPVFECVIRKVIHVSSGMGRARSYDIVVKGKCVNPLKVNKSLKNKQHKKYSKFIGKESKNKVSGNKSNAMTVLNRTVVINKLTSRPDNLLIATHEEKENNRPPVAASSPLSQMKKQVSSLLQETKNFSLAAQDTSFSNVHDIGTPDHFYSDSDKINVYRLKGLALIDKVGLSPQTSLFPLNSRRSTFAKTYTDDYNDELNLPLISSTNLQNNLSPCSISFTDSLDTSSTNDDGKSDSYKTALTTPLKPDNEFNDTKILNNSFSSMLDEDVNVSNGDRSLERGDLLIISPPSMVNSSRRKKWKISPRSCRKVVHRISLSRTRLSSPCSLRKKMRKKKTPSPKSAKKKLGTIKQLYATHSDDPFFKMLAYHDEEWVDRQEVDIIKWMNSLLTPPVEFQRTTEEKLTVENVADMWVKSSQETDIKLAPSKEYFASVLYHCPQQLNTLRKAALIFYHSDPIAGVLSKLSSAVEKKTISIREDRDLHLDQGLRFKLLHLLGSYNPLWLRIGLEVIYDQRIPIVAKCDVGGLGNFIRKNLFVNEYIIRKHSHPTVVNMKLPTFKDAMKKFILKKILMLIYFLDKAKLKKLIRHDPCLFLKSSEYKSSAEILLAFCGDLVIGHGDIIKHLRYMNYVLAYKQTHLDEYDYGLVNLLALRDGVHIARMLEILIGPQVDLCSKLRVPAISLLQKQHNVRISLEALRTVCEIKGNICAQDIARGYREKTLSLLWQIINNYVAPRYNKAASTIQRWWRCLTLRKTMIDLVRKKRDKVVAVRKIIHWWRATNGLRREINRRVFQRRLRNRILSLPTDNFRRLFHQLSSKYRRYSISNTSYVLFDYEQIIALCAVIIVQRRFRARRLAIYHRERFERLKRAVLTIQRRFRTGRIRRSFCRLKRYVKIVQNRFRARRLSIVERNRYLRLKTTAIFVQNRYRSIRLTRRCRAEFLRIKNVLVNVQRRLRAKRHRRLFLERKRACVRIQRWYRTMKLKRTLKLRYLRRKASVRIIENYYKNYVIAKATRNDFLRLKNAARTIETYYRARSSMLREKAAYDELRNACVIVQRRYRASRAAKRDSTNYRRLKEAVRITQTRFRANRLASRYRSEYVSLKRTVVLVQRKYRAKLIARRCRKRFLELKATVTMIKNRYRSRKIARSERDSFLRLRTAVLSIQRRFRTTLLVRRRFLTLKRTAIIVQRRYRATKSMRLDRGRYLTWKRNAIIIQRWYRARTLMLRCSLRERYLLKKNAVLTIQRAYRNYRTAKSERERFLRIKNSAVIVQSCYRMLIERRRFLAVKNTITFVQRRYRRKLAERSIVMNAAAVKIQALWRGYRVRKMKLLKKFVMPARGNEKYLTKGTLRDRYGNALLLLKTSDMYNVVIRALCNLDCVTNLSGKLCEDLTGEGVVNLIVGFLQRTNRSLPSLELSKIAIKVLINLTRHKPTVAVVWSALKDNEYGGLSHLIHIMKYTHEKFTDVLFLYATTLLWLLIYDKSIAEEIAAIDVIKKQMDYIACNLQRKSTINPKIRKPRPVYPSLVPSWDASFKDPFFDDHYFAICCIRKKLFPEW